MAYNGSIMTYLSDPENPPVTTNRVREYRIKLDYTQAQLAEKVGISRTAVTAIEGSHLVPSVATALGLATALKTTVENLFGNSPMPSSKPAWA